MRLSTSPTLCRGEVMRSEFQDVFKDAYDHWIDDACSHRYHASKSLALQVWQHQQSKVDELQKQLIDQGQRFNEQVQRVKDLEHKNGELQKRVDAALKITGDNLRYVSQNHRDIFKPLLMTMIRSFKELEQALKGGVE